MFLNKLLEENNISRYTLSKITAIPYTTLTDLCSGKSDLMKCSVDTIYKISVALNISVDELIKKAMYENSDFNLFRSNVSHDLKFKGDIQFMIDLINDDTIAEYWNENKFAESLYLLALLDYLSRVNEIPICTKYSYLRKNKLVNPLFPSGIMALSIVNGDNKYQTEAVENAIPEFLRFNIIECEVRDAI